MIISVSQKDSLFLVVIDFEETLLPRLVPLRNLTNAIQNVNALPSAIYENGLGLINNNQKNRQESKAFILISTSQKTTSVLAHRDRWTKVQNCNAEIYARKKTGSTTRRLVLKTSYNNHNCICVIQYQADQFIKTYLIDPREATDLPKLKFKKELFLHPEYCQTLIQLAVDQNKTVNITTACLLDSKTLIDTQQELVMVVEGELKATKIHDGEKWKNNSSNFQRKACHPSTETKKVTTYIPFHRATHPKLTGPLHKKEHVTLNGYTLIYYHIQASKKTQAKTQQTEAANENVKQRNDNDDVIIIEEIKDENKTINETDLRKIIFEINNWQK
jgi:hypothetical protein